MRYEPTTTSAIAHASHGRLEEWVHLFLCNEGCNVPFSDGLKLEPRRYTGPQQMDLCLLIRCCGPEDNMKFQEPARDFRKRVASIMKKYKTGKWDMPPLIANRVDGHYELNDGNHRLEALKSLGITSFWVIIWETVT